MEDNSRFDYTEPVDPHNRKQLKQAVETAYEDIYNDNSSLEKKATARMFLLGIYAQTHCRKLTVDELANMIKTAKAKNVVNENEEDN